MLSEKFCDILYLVKKMDKSELAEKIENGEFTIDDVLDFFKVLAEIANASEEIQDEIEGWDRVLLFSVTSGPKVTLTVKDGKFEVEDGEQGTPDITLAMNSDVAVGVLSGETDAVDGLKAAFDTKILLTLQPRLDHRIRSIHPGEAI